MSTGKQRILILDTTLRDGEQSPGAGMAFEEKVKIAEMLESMGVDIIEAGFPASSEADYLAVSAIGAKVRDSVVSGLCRAVRSDIDRCAEALSACTRKRIHTFISTSRLHMEYKLNMTERQVLEAVKDSVRYARNFCDDVEWSCEDGTRSDREFLCRCFDTAIKAGATTVNIADTVGYTIPEEFADLILYLRNNVTNIDKVTMSVHCHNDLGLAVSNSLSAIGCGVSQVECTVNGIGERAGNASLEELVMALKVRSDILPYYTRVKTEYFRRISDVVAEASGYAVAPNKAIVGRNVFTHESGIHQHGVLMHRGTYEIIDPTDVGVSESTLTMGKRSGRHAFRDKVEKLGIMLTEDEFREAFQSFKAYADKKGKTVSDEEIYALTKN